MLGYVNELETLPAVVFITHVCILEAALALPFGIALTCTPTAGLIALIFFTLTMIYMGFNIFSPRGGDAVVIKELHERLRKMYIKKGFMKIKHENNKDTVNSNIPESSSASDNLNNISDSLPLSDKVSDKTDKTA